MGIRILTLFSIRSAEMLRSISNAEISMSQIVCIVPNNCYVSVGSLCVAAIAHSMYYHTATATNPAQAASGRKNH